jgi:hypothetical protein
MPSEAESHRQVERRLNALRKTLDSRWVRSVGLSRIWTIDDLVYYVRESGEIARRRAPRIPDDIPYGLALIYRGWARKAMMP